MPRLFLLSLSAGETGIHGALKAQGWGRAFEAASASRLAGGPDFAPAAQGRGEREGSDTSRFFRVPRACENPPPLVLRPRRNGIEVGWGDLETKELARCEHERASDGHEASSRSSSAYESNRAADREVKVEPETRG